MLQAIKLKLGIMMLQFELSALDQDSLTAFATFAQDDVEERVV